MVVMVWSMSGWMQRLASASIVNNTFDGNLIIQGLGGAVLLVGTAGSSLHHAGSSNHFIVEGNTFTSNNAFPVPVVHAVCIDDC